MTGPGIISGLPRNWAEFLETRPWFVSDVEYAKAAGTTVRSLEKWKRKHGPVAAERRKLKSAMSEEEIAEQYDGRKYNLLTLNPRRAA